MKYFKPISSQRQARMSIGEKAVRIGVFLPIIICLNLPMIALILLFMGSVGGWLFVFLMYGISKDPWAYSAEIVLAVGFLVFAFICRKLGNHLTWNYLPNVR